MRASQKFAATALAGTLLATALATGATAADGTTTVTFSSVSTLTIVPATAAVLTMETGGTHVSGSLGLTSVLDPEGASRTVTLSTTGFKEVGGTATIGVDKVAACSSTPTTLVGSVTLTAGTLKECPTYAALGATSGALDLFQVTTGAASEFTFTPQLRVDVQNTAASVFEGTIKQTIL